MSRSPLAYPLSRSADTDVGGAADLQTDVMRFMAILALCLVAIFALVQSIPLAPALVETPMAVEPAAVRSEALPAEPVVTPDPVLKPVAEPAPEPVVVLTRPELKRNLSPSRQTSTPTTELPTPREEIQPPVVASATPTEREMEGFTLRFASDAALMRAVAAHKVGVYAIEPGRARRMTVSESRIGFWDASMPNSFHEMEPETVPAAVTSALARTGAATDSVNWGVTLPGGMTSQLDALMAQHRGGALIIGAHGEIHWEATQ